MQSEQSEEVLCGILGKIKGPVALAFSHQAEDAVVLDLLTRRHPPENLEVFTVDTKKLFPETLAYHEEAEKFFRVSIKKYYPEEEEEQRLEGALGKFGMRESLENRQLCCRVRKVEPLGRALLGKSAWLTGLRASQSESRSGLPLLEYDEKYAMLKINPLASWSADDVSSYIKERGLPVHPLYSQGFKSIGCAPCTRAVKEGEDIRAGRWWWERPEHKGCKECGMHLRE